MRGNITDQDLTDYALNELSPTDRLYVESMLAVSEECREDIYRNIELAQLLEEAFERETITAEVKELRSEQREKLVQPHFTRRYLIRDLVAAVGLAACVTFAAVELNQYDFTGAATAADRMADASTKAAGAVQVAVQSPGSFDLSKSLEALRSLAEESARMVPVNADLISEPPAICTPPTLVMESAQLTGIDGM